MLDALELGYTVKERRIELGLTQAQLANAAGVSKRCLWSLELGQSSGIQLNKLLAILHALGIDLQIVTKSTSAYEYATTTLNDKIADEQHSKRTDRSTSSNQSSHESKKTTSTFSALDILTEGKAL